MMDVLLYLLLTIVVAGAVVVAVLYLRGSLTGTSPTAALFGPRPSDGSASSSSQTSMAAVGSC